MFAAVRDLSLQLFLFIFLLLALPLLVRPSFPLAPDETVGAEEKDFGGERVTRAGSN
jgi:hypothetical protein